MKDFKYYVIGDCFTVLGLTILLG